jgi:serine/threonine-protein kinase RsbW
MVSKSLSSLEFDPQNLVRKLKVSLSADKAAVDSVVQRIMAIIEDSRCAVGKEDDIELALAEALANAVVHGAQGDPSRVVQCDVACDEARGVLIIVRDPGDGFDLASIPSPLQGENLYSGHGRGIYLINQLMDDVKFHKNGAEIRMIKR